MWSQEKYRESFANFAQTFAPFAFKKGFIINFCLIVLFSITPVFLYGQSEKISEIIIDIAEELAADDTDPESLQIYVDRLHELAETPVKINSAGEDEISRLFFLSDFQVKALAEYVHSSGRIVSVYELAAIPGFDKETVGMIIPFITLEYRTSGNADTVRWRNTLISNFSIKAGNDDTSNLGSAWRVMTKYKFTAGGFTGGITMEKDPGERLLTGTPPLPDFLSAHIAYYGSGVLRRIIVGDYSARFGQGTNINTGIRRGISLTMPGYMSASDEIKPHTSTEENRFFRGLAAGFSFRNIELNIYFSKNYSDATITSSPDSSKDYVENFYTAGVHNTSSMLKKKDALTQLTYGMTLSYNLNNLKVGLVWSENRLSLPVNTSGNDPAKIFDVEGNKFNIYSLYYNTFIKRILIYGELSVNENKKRAVIQGFSFRPSDRLTLNILIRNYSAGFTTLFGSGPGTGSKTTNEKGILGNFTYEAARHLFISAGCDIQHFPWLKYRCSAPSWGMRQEIKARYIPSEKLSFDALYSYRLSMTDYPESIAIPGQEEVHTRSYKVSARYTVQNTLTLGTRIDYKVVNPAGDRGYMLFQEINYSFRKVPLTLWARYCLFFTEGWTSRIYTYENDLLYSFSIPALAGEGSRSYIMARWKVSDFGELRIKYGITSLVNNGMSGENTGEIKMQFRIWF